MRGLFPRAKWHMETCDPGTTEANQASKPLQPPLRVNYLSQGHQEEGRVSGLCLGGPPDFLPGEKAYQHLCFGKLTVNPSIL